MPVFVLAPAEVRPLLCAVPKPQPSRTSSAAPQIFTRRPSASTRYRVTKVQGDWFGGEWPREQFRKHGITYQLSENAKGSLYLNALPLINSGRVRLLDNKRLVSQLVGLERSTARGGRDSIDHARGGHDDVANAAAGALLAATASLPNTRTGFCLGVGPIKWGDEEEHPSSSLCRNEAGDLVLRSWCV